MIVQLVYLLVVVQSKHSVVEAEQNLNLKEGQKSIILKMDIFLMSSLTDDAIKDLPVRGIENPVWLTGGEDKRSCKPIMVEHLQWVGLKKEKQFAAKFKQSCLTSPSGQTKVKLNPTGGAGCKSVRRNLFQTCEHNCSGDNLCFQTRCNRSQRLPSL